MKFIKKLYNEYGTGLTGITKPIFDKHEEYGIFKKKNDFVYDTSHSAIFSLRHTLDSLVIDSNILIKSKKKKRLDIQNKIQEDFKDLVKLYTRVQEIDKDLDKLHDEHFYKFDEGERKVIIEKYGSYINFLNEMKNDAYGIAKTQLNKIKSEYNNKFKQEASSIETENIEVNIQSKEKEVWVNSHFNKFFDTSIILSVDLGQKYFDYIFKDSNEFKDLISQEVVEKSTKSLFCKAFKGISKIIPLKIYPVRKAINIYVKALESDYSYTEEEHAFLTEYEKEVKVQDLIKSLIKWSVNRIKGEEYEFKEEYKDTISQYDSPLVLAEEIEDKIIDMNIEQSIEYIHNLIMPTQAT